MSKTQNSVKVFEGVSQRNIPIQVYITPTAKEYDEERDEDFGSGSYKDLCVAVADYVDTYAGYVAGFQLACEQTKDKFKFCFQFKNREQAAIFIGKNAKNLQSLFNWLRAQQIYPHSRHIQVVIIKEDEVGDNKFQSFVDRDDGFWDRKTLKTYSESALKRELNRRGGEQ